MRDAILAEVAVTLGGGAVLTTLTVTDTAGIGGAPVLGRVLAVYGTSVVSSGGAAYGIESNPTLPATATTFGAAINAQLVTAASVFSIASAAAIHVPDASLGVGSSVGDAYGILIEGQTKGSTNNFGLSIRAPSGASVNNVGLRAGGGNIAILVDATFTATAATKFGIRSGGAFNSSTTTSAFAMYSWVRTVAGAYTIANAYGLFVVTPEIGAGSAITTLTGIHVAAQAGATTHSYGIRVAGASGAVSGDNASILATPGNYGVWVSGASAGTATTKIGILSVPTFDSTTTVKAAAMQAQVVTAATGFTITNAYGLLIATPSKGGGSAITNAYGLYVDAQTAGASVNYGINISGPSGAPDGFNRAIQAIVGDRGVSVTGVSTGAATSKLGVHSSPTWDSSTTGAGFVFRGQLATEAAAFTMTSGYGLYIDTPLIGAGSAVTNVYGIYVDEQPSGSHVWYAETDSTDSHLSQAGVLTIASHIISTEGSLFVPDIGGLVWDTRSTLASPADGDVILTNSAGDGFDMLMFGGATAAFPALQRTGGTGLRARLANDSANTLFSAASFTADAGATAFIVNGRGALGAVSDGVWTIADNSGADFGLLCFGTNLSGYPALKRSGAALQARLGDDSAYAAFAALSYSAGATAGVTAGPFTTVSSIETIGGLVTTLTGT